MALLPNFDNIPERIQTTIRRLPVLTRVAVGLSILLYLASFISSSLILLLELDAAHFGFSQLHRLNTYPFVHFSLIHVVLNVVAILQPLSRFEREKGTLHTLLMILGPFSTFPAVAYIIVMKLLFNSYGSFGGMSIWILMFAAMDTTMVYKHKPFYWVAGYRIPSWAPVVGLWLLFEMFIFSGGGFFIHLSAMVVGWAYASEYLKLLEPPEKVLRFIETRLKFLISRVPFYMSLDMRETAGHNLFLPTFQDEPTRGIDLPSIRMNPRGTAGNEPNNFRGAGRTVAG